jgi:7,8-dihydropterin-6-yl-methyl-4-(beta-D-ribofuranosyl)aminobenzene 5'-phosphate synthase
MFESEPQEQALVINSDGVTAVISGCSHPGMEHIVEHATRLLGAKVDWAIGGFHLMYADAGSIAETIRALQRLGVDAVVPTHCTGDAAKCAFQQAYGARCIDGGVGRAVELLRRRG